MRRHSHAARLAAFATASLIALVSIALPARAATDFAKMYGAAWNPSIATWLPNPDAGFEVWSKKTATVVKGYDYFVCGSSARPSVPTHDFSYAGSVCAPLRNGTAFVFGTAEPIRGRVVYDRARAVVLYDEGCCAWRGFALRANVAPPAKPVANADLSRVRTMRGIALGMTHEQVAHIYGPATPYAVKNRPGFVRTTYTTMTGGPNDSQACGQFQSFTFKQNRLVSIELLAGC